MGRINKMFNIKLLNMNKLFFGVVALVLMVCGCSSTNSTEKYQSSRDNVIDVKDKIHEIPTEDPPLSSVIKPFVAGNYLVVGDYKSIEMMLSVYDTEHLNYLASFGSFGPGPNEITRFGGLSWNPFSQESLVFDAGKLLLYSYNIDSVLSNKNYTPTIKMELDTIEFPEFYQFINDSIAIGTFVTIDDYNTHHKTTGRININTGKYDLFGYKHPDIKRYLTAITVSMRERIIAEIHMWNDLISIYDFQGNLIRNIYGPQWGKDNLSCFWECFFTKDYLITDYSGHNRDDEIIKPNQILIFDLNGDYVATLDIGYLIYRMCYDEQHNRIIFSFDDAMQMGYLELDEIKFD